MNIHEYQAKSLLANFGVSIPKGKVVFSVEEAADAAKSLGGPIWVVKAQIHAGGRGKGGGVKVVDSMEKLISTAREILGMQLVTHQTGPQGQKVKCLYIEEQCSIVQELYLGLLVDCSSSRVTVIGSTEGGIDIEEVAASMPDKIIKVVVDPMIGLQPFHARKLAYGLGLSGGQVKSAIEFLQATYRAFIELDVSMVEINPLVIKGQGELVALDAKMCFDSNALYRHPDIEALRDKDEEDPTEIEAHKHKLNYIKLDGSIGCMVNGAGLAMATMDIIQLYGSSPANFLDVGGDATKERVTVAFKIILSDSNVEGILVNIFGGIMRCDVIAEGIVAAAREMELDVPLVVRLEGTNVDKGKETLASSGLPIVSANNLADGARKVINAVQHNAQKETT